MVETQTTRFKLPQWSAGTDAYPGRTGFNNFLKLLEDQAALAFPSGPISSRPASGAFGRFYLATDQGGGGRLYYDGGSGWIELNTNGGGGPGRAIVVGGSGSEGTGNRSARGDHTHSIPFASSTTHGAMSSEMYQLLNSAQSGVTGGAIVRRTSSGNVAVPMTPSGDDSAPSKQWVEDVVGTSNLTPNSLVRRYSNGAFRAGMSDHLDDVVSNRRLESLISPALTGGEGKIMRRWASGVGALVADPDHNQAPATKVYVDRRVSRKAWKENPRALPYGVDEVEALAKKALLYDYKDTEDAPLSVRGEKNHFGAYVEDFAQIMPLLTTEGEDGEPERIIDRELIWPVIRSIGQLALSGRAKDERIEELEEENDRLQDRLRRIENHLDLA